MHVLRAAGHDLAHEPQRSSLEPQHQETWGAIRAELKGWGRRGRSCSHFAPHSLHVPLIDLFIC